MFWRVSVSVVVVVVVCWVEAASAQRQRQQEQLKIEVLSRPGVCNSQAATGDKVQVHYVGKLVDGIVFDQRYDFVVVILDNTWYLSLLLP